MSKQNPAGTAFAASVTNPVALAAALVATILTAGCAEYTDRRESISYTSGDAVAANKALQVIDPWDRRAAWIDIDQDGNRAVSAVDIYRSGGETESSDAGSTLNGAPSLTQ